MRLVTSKRKINSSAHTGGWVRILIDRYFRPNFQGAIVKVLDKKCDYPGGVVVTGVPGTVIHLSPEEFVFVHDEPIQF